MENSLVDGLIELGIVSAYRDYSQNGVIFERSERVNKAGLEAIKIKKELKQKSRALDYISSDLSFDSILDFALVPRRECKYATERDNEANLCSLDENSQLVFLIHGLSVPGIHLDGRYFMPLRRALFAKGINTFAIDYNDCLPFEEYSHQILDKINLISRQLPLSIKIHAIGHSTGADILRYLTANKCLLDKPRLDKVILAAPTTNGKIKDLLDNLAFGSKVEYCNPLNKNNVLNSFFISNPNKPLTLLSTGDCFIPMDVALDITGRNLIVSGAGHLAASGCNTTFNQIYLNILKN
jgi:hypothetical protein